MIKSGNKFAHITTAQLSWYVQIYDLVSNKSNRIRFKIYIMSS